MDPQPGGEENVPLADQHTLARPAEPASSRILGESPTLAPRAEEGEHPLLAPPLRPGHLGSVGPYPILRHLGKGGMGLVFEGIDPTLDRVVAIKVMAPGLAASPGARERFLREARAAAKVRHGNIVAIHAVDEADGVPYIVMQRVAGQSLQDLLERSGPRPPEEAARLILQAARGLEAARSHGVVHRDIKPANILLEDGTGTVKLTDFGLARAADDVSLTQSGAIAGTPSYMSPEQAMGKPVDHRSDLFSLGGVLYALLSGKPPFTSSSTLDILCKVTDEEAPPLPGLPPWLNEALAGLHAKDPAHRFQTAAELAAFLERNLDPPPVPKRGRPVLWAALAVGPVLAALAFLFWPRPRVDEPKPDSLPDGFVPLLDGEGLAGWRPHPRQPGKVEVHEAGAVSMYGPTSHLYTARNDYANFHLRAEARLAPQAEGGVVLRARFGPRANRVVPDGYEARLDGTLVGLAKSARPAPADGWFLYEVIAEGHRLRVLIDGEMVADVTDPDKTHARGAIALQKYGPGTVEFRNVAVKELPGLPEPPPAEKPKPSIATVPPTLKLALSARISPALAKSRYTRLALSADGKTLAAARHDGAILIYADEGKAWKLVATLEGRKFAPLSLSFGPDGNRLAAGTSDRVIRVWTFEDGRGWGPPTELASNAVAQALTFSPDGKTLYAGGASIFAGGPGQVKAWNLDDGTDSAISFRQPPPRSVLSLAVSPDGQLAAGYQHFKSSLWERDASGGVAPAEMRACMYAALPAIAAAPGGRLLAASSLHAASALPKSVPWVRSGDGGMIACMYAMAFSSDGKLLGEGGCTLALNVRFREGKEWKEAWAAGPAGIVRGLAFSPDGKQVVTYATPAPTPGAPPGAVRALPSVEFWDGHTGERLGALEGNAPTAFAAASSAPRIAVTDALGNISVWNYSGAGGTGPADFVIPASDGRPEWRGRNLAGAAARARSGDTIEIRGNGPYEMDTVTIGRKDLTIRAAPGFTPVLRLKPGGTKSAYRTLINSTGSLVLEGLDLRRGLPEMPGNESVVLCTGQRFHVANCRVSAPGEVFPLRAVTGTSYEARNCLFVTDWPAVGWLQPSPGGKLVVENCLMSGDGVWVMPHAAFLKGGTLDVKVARCTVTGQMHAELRVIGESPPFKPGEGRNTFLWETEGSVLAGGDRYFRFRRFVGKKDPREFDEKLKEWVTMREIGNLHGPSKTYLEYLVSLKDVRVGGDRTKLSEWRAFWGLTQPHLEGKPLFVGGDVRQRARARPDTITPEDFRLHPDGPGWRAGPGGRDVGADVDLVGPGPAYERWKKTPDYKSWQERSSPPPKPPPPKPMPKEST